GGSHAPRQSYVIVLDEHRIKQPGAVICGTARAHGVLFQHTQGRCGFPGVENDHSSTRRGNEPTGAGRDARQALNKVEGGSLAHEERACRCDDVGNRLARCATFAVMLMSRDAYSGLDLTKSFKGHIEPGEHAVAFRNEYSARPLIRRNRS